MPSTLLEWLAALSISGTGLWFCTQILFRLGQLYELARDGIEEVKRLRREHNSLKDNHLALTGRVTENEHAVARLDESHLQLREDFGLAR